MKYSILALLGLLPAVCFAADINDMKHAAQATVYSLAQDKNKPIGSVSFHDTANGLNITAHLKNLPSGTHGFHVHQYPDCNSKWEDGHLVLGGMAGGHYDPAKTNKHLGPTGNGHKGDLPPLTVDDNGVVNTSFVMPHLTIDDVKNRSIVVHEGGDNFSDEPLPSGGGGSPIACGVIR